MQESQIDTSTTERQLLYDIRTEMRKTNELLTVIISRQDTAKQDALNDLLSKLLESLNPIAKGLVQKEVNVVKRKVTPKRGNTIAKIK